MTNAQLNTKNVDGKDEYFVGMRTRIWKVNIYGVTENISIRKKCGQKRLHRDDKKVLKMWIR